MITALYLAHLNPVTNAHVEIITELKKEADIVKVMPVVFKKGNQEVNSKSFPFNFETRKKMLMSVFGDSIQITDDYAFLAPFKKYLPPLLRRRSWRLRKQILSGVEGDFFSYTGDKAEGYMLKIYRLKPKIGERKSISASSVMLVCPFTDKPTRIGYVNIEEKGKNKKFRCSKKALKEKGGEATKYIIK